MLNWIRESKLVKPLGGIMLTSMILSFSFSFFRTPTLSRAEAKPTVTEVLPKANSRQETVSMADQATVNEKIEPAGSQEHNQGQPVIQDKSLAVKDETTGKKTATWSPVQPVQATPTQAPSPAVKVSSQPTVDIYLLARVIHAESRGEPFQGQVAVGAVLLNRLKDSRFPNSLSQIIFKKGEFCTVRDGQIWKTPSQEALKAARLAVAGWDPTGGALYFYNPAKTTSRWIWSRPVVNRIGNHVFAA